MSVFNFKVQGYHTYYVREHGSRGPPVLVHNADYEPERVDLYHGSRDGIEGGELDFDVSKNVRRKTHLTPEDERAIYFTDDPNRAATQYATPKGEVAKVSVPKEMADEMRGKDKHKRVEYKATSQDQLDAANEFIEVLPQRDAAFRWVFGQGSD